MQKKRIAYVVCFMIILSLLSLVYSCAKSEPAAKPAPDEIMTKITGQFQEYDESDDTNNNRKFYKSGIKAKELSESAATEIYSTDKNKPVDLSKIETYSIIQANEDNADEIGIFKLYDKVNTDYVKEMVQTRITKMQDKRNSGNDTEASETVNNAEIRSYGVYVYYVAHPQKDKIFKIIEDSLKGV